MVLEDSAEEDSFIPGDYKQAPNRSHSAALEQAALRHIPKREATYASTGVDSTVPIAGPDFFVSSSSTPNTPSAPTPATLSGTKTA